MKQLNPRPFARKSIWQLKRSIDRGTSAIKNWHKPRFEPDTEEAASRRATRQIKAEGWTRVIQAVVAEIKTRLAVGPKRDARPLKKQRKYVAPVSQPTAEIAAVLDCP